MSQHHSSRQFSSQRSFKPNSLFSSSHNNNNFSSPSTTTSSSKGIDQNSGVKDIQMEEAHDQLLKVFGTSPSLSSPGNTVYYNMGSEEAFSLPPGISQTGMSSAPIDVKRTTNYQPTLGALDENGLSMSFPLAHENGDWILNNSLIQTNSLRTSSFSTSDLASSLPTSVAQKKQKRRESHNAVERRRRDLINERITELGTLLPDIETEGGQKPHKGQILKKAVDYVLMLKQTVLELAERNKQLEVEINAVRTAQASCTTYEPCCTQYYEL